MPILDIISQIEGGKPAPSPAAPIRSLAPVKRKAEDDARNDSAKSPRTSGPGSSAAASSRPSSNSTAPVSVSRPVPATSNEKKTTIPQRSTMSQPASRSHNAPPERSSLNLNTVKSGRISKPSGPARPSTISATAAAMAAAAIGASSDAPKTAPKKGSFAEILARGQRAQEMMKGVGKIQHKPIERTSKKDVKEEPPKTLTRKPTLPTPVPALKRVGSQPLPSPRNNAPASGTAKTGRNGVEPQGKDAKNGAKPPEPEKKVRKAVSATTGYTGTARPKPGASSKNKQPDATTRAGLVNPYASRGGKSTGRSHYDDGDDDEDMDDFIEYDDDDEPDDRRRRYDYDSDGSSDMEAGLDDIDDEERFAERQARIEDLREEENERKAREAKLERKKRVVEQSRPRR